jgi:hypothetical protein
MLEGMNGGQEKSQSMLEATVSEHKNRMIKVKDEGGIAKNVE